MVFRSSVLLAVAIMLAGWSSTAVADNERTDPQAPLAWQRTDKYAPPDFESYFPDDEAGGRRLDELYEGKLGKNLGSKEILQIVRQGLRRMKNHKTLMLAQVGNTFIWNVKQQDPLAIELMYHASDSPDSANTGHYALYYGLTVVNERSDNLLRTLMDRHASYGVETQNRMVWGFKTYGDQADTTRRLENLLSAAEPLSTQGQLAAYTVYEQFTGRKPPQPERFADLGVFLVGFRHDDAKTKDDYTRRLNEELQVGPRLVDHVTRRDDKGLVDVALVRGIAGRDDLLHQFKERQGYHLEFEQLFTVESLHGRRLAELGTHLPNGMPALKWPKHDPDYEPYEKNYDWNRSDKYVPPDFAGYFPDDEQAGKQLDEAFEQRDNMQLTDKEFLELFRRGLRRSTAHTQTLFSWFAYSFMYSWPRDPYAVEMMYHAMAAPPRPGVASHHDIKHGAEYYALTSIQDKPDNLLRGFQEAYLVGDRGSRGRILWSIRTPREKTFMAERFAEALDSYQSLSEEQVVAAYHAYRELTGQDPPQPERFDAIGLFLIMFRHNAIQTPEAMTEHLKMLAGSPGWVDSMTHSDKNHVFALALVRGPRSQQRLILRLQADSEHLFDYADQFTAEIARQPTFAPLAKYLQPGETEKKEEDKK